MQIRWAFARLLTCLFLLVSSAGAQRHYGVEESLLTMKQTVQTFAVGDLSGDGRPDIVLGMRTTGTVPDEVWIQEPNGAYKKKMGAAALSKLIVPVKSTGTYHLLLGDIDNDGDLDIVRQWTASVGKEIWFREILWNDGKGGFAYSTRLPGGMGQFGGPMRLVDIDKDGDLDLVLAEGFLLQFNKWAFGQPHLYLNSGAGVFREIALPFIKKPAVCTDVRVLDIDSNGLLDIFYPVEVVKYGSQTATFSTRDTPVVFLNKGSKGWVDGTKATAIPARTEGMGQVLMDLDLDGDLDIALPVKGQTGIRLIENRGKGVYREVLAGLLPGVKGISFDLSPFDVDGDGKPELLVSYIDATYNPHIVVYRPAAGFALKAMTLQSWLPGSAGSFKPGKQRFIDTDGDGDIDLLYLSPSTKAILLRRGLRQELMLSPPKLGQTWKIGLTRTPAALKRKGIAAIAFAGRATQRGLPVVGLGMWFLPTSGIAWSLPQALKSPGGVTSWALVVPATPSWLGKPITVQGICWDPNAGWSLTRAASYVISR